MERKNIKNGPLCLVLVTAGSRKEARTIATALLRAKLAACVNIIPGIESHYWWQGKLESTPEFLLVIKSTRQHFARLAGLVRAHHGYATPEIIALPVVTADPAYAGWWRDSMRK